MNSYTKGIAALWLIIAGFILIAGSGYWFWVDDIKPYLNKESDPNWFVGDENRLNNEINKNSVETADWQTYRNEKYGFEFKYPGDRSFKLTEIQNSKMLSVDFTGKGGDSINDQLTIYFDIPSESYPQASLDEKIANSGSKIPYTQFIGFDSFYVWRCQDGWDIAENVIRTCAIQHGKDVYYFDYSDVSKSIISRQDFDAIVRSFHFASQSDLDISTWQTYRNEKYGFEVKYPKKISEVSWVYRTRSEDEGRIISFQGQDDALEIVIVADDNPKNLDLRSWANQSNLGGQGSWESHFTLKNYNGTEVLYHNEMECGRALFVKGKDYYQIDNGWNTCVLDVNEFDAFLSTFRFFEVITLPIVDTSSWLEYKNDQYGFKIKYPYDWVWKDLLPNNQHLANDVVIGFAPKSFGGMDFEVLIQVNKRGLDANVNEISSQLNENTALVSVSNILFKDRYGKKIILRNKTTKSNSTMIILGAEDNLSYIISLPDEDDFRLFSTLEFF